MTDRLVEIDSILVEQQRSTLKQIIDEAQRLLDSGRPVTRKDASVLHGLTGTLGAFASSGQ